MRVICVFFQHTCTTHKACVCGRVCMCVWECACVCGRLAKRNAMLFMRSLLNGLLEVELAKKLSYEKCIINALDCPKREGRERERE